MVDKQFEGVFAPIPAPFSPGNYTIDFEFIKNHLTFLEEKGIQGVLVSGTNGEFPSLSVDERKSILSWVMKYKGNLKVIAQTGTSSFVETINLCDYVIQQGVDALLICTPYYYKNISDNGLTKYYSEIFNRIDFPIFLYNMPQVTHVKITGPVVKNLLHFENFLGIKESTGIWEETKYYIESFPKLHIFVGKDTLFSDALEIGAGGSITAVANAFPSLLVEVFDSFKKKINMNSAQSKLTAFRELLQKYPFQPATKYILKLKGLGDCTVRPPLQDLSEEQKQELKRELEKLCLDFF